MEDSKSARLIKLLELKGVKNLHQIPHISSFSPKPSEHLEVLVRVLEVALHRKKHILQKGIVSAAREMNRYVDAFLLGYGLCGNALRNPIELLDVDVPVFYPVDDDHPVDDCVSMIMGGRDCYYAEQCRIPGTYFMTPGWTYHWKSMFGHNPCNIDSDILKRVFKKYKRSLLVLTPVMPEDEMKQNTEEFDKLLKLQVEEHKGTIEILNTAWKKAKSFIKTKIE
ncbi:MAG: DUF1638 domain-containing protein [Bacteroidales bacterium]|nr:DUF1638 domain-containing protein [Bacteroidales bacterium]